MPLQQGSSKATISRNIAELVRAGHPQKQAEAIAFKTAGRDIAEDMSDEDFDELVALLRKWVNEEREEPEHDAAADSFEGLVEKLQRKGYSKAYATKVAGKVAEEKGDRASDALPFAQDKESVRDVDEFGRMHIAEANISKAVVNPYYGKEIPGWEELGLSPERIYYMLRDPVELAKSVSTWNKVPLLIKHIGHSADTPVKDSVAGTTGESAVFEPPYLKNSLCLWDGHAIAGVEAGKQRELSCSYAYRPDMTPGEYEGARYDGVMRDIVGNHVALVTRGRAGGDVMVGDAALSGDTWEESKHPRAASGQFGSGSGSSTSKRAPNKAATQEESVKQHRAAQISSASEAHAKAGAVMEKADKLRSAQGLEPHVHLEAAKRQHRYAGKFLYAAQHEESARFQDMSMMMHHMSMEDHHHAMADYEGRGGSNAASEAHKTAGAKQAVKKQQYSERLERARRHDLGMDATAADGLGFSNENTLMKNAGIIAVRTALGVYLRPLANDAAPLRDLVKPGMSVDDVAKSVKKHYAGQFAVDSKELAQHLKLVRDEAEEMDAEDEEEAEDEDEEERKKREEEEAKARDKRAKDRKAKDKRAKDDMEDEDDDAEDRKRAKDKKRAKDGDPPAGPSGPRDRSAGKAEDADSIRAQIRQDFRDIRVAEDAVRPLVGQLAAMDSADDVYAEALKQLGVNTAGIHPSAFPALIDAQKQIRSNSHRRVAAPLAGDSGNVQTVVELFPGARKPMRA